ncbi:Proline-rich receptor-like protein [Drosera capensis]
MLLELITGRQPVDPNMSYMEDSLVDWARPLLTKALEDGNFKELADPRLEQNYSSEEMAHMVACAAASIRHSARRRPKMSQIVRALEGDASLDDLNEGVRPGQSTVYSSSTGSSEYDARTYSADLKKFRQMAFGSQELGSSMYTGDGNTSEYGMNPSSSSSSANSSREMGTRKMH